MDFRAVFIFLFLLITKAACRPVENEAKEAALNMTIDMTREVIQTALGHLTVPGLLPNMSCNSVNMMEQQIHNLSSYRCYIQKLSACIPQLSEMLDRSCQYLLDAEQLHSGKTIHVSCKLPTFEEDHYIFMYAKCLLQFVDERLSNSISGTISF